MQIFAMHWMPWPYLPESFGDQGESSMLTAPNRLYDPVKGGDLFNEWLDLLEYSEELGYDGVCYNEHHQWAHAHVPAVNLITAALMRRTTKLKFAPVGHVVPTYHPVQLAEEIAMLDVISRGRVIVGVAKGIGSEYIARNIRPSDVREMFDEQMEIMLRAWTEEEPFAHQGKFYNLPCVNIWPKPLQKPHPQIWVPSAGTPGTAKWAAKYRYPMIKGFDSDENVLKTFEQYAQATEEFGYELPASQVGLSKHIYLADSDEEALKRGTPHFEYTFRKLFKGPSEYWFPPGTVPPFAYEGASKGIQSRGTKSVAEYNQSGHVLMGSPQTVIEHLSEFHRKRKFDILVVTFALGQMDLADSKRNLEMFSREVMPALRKLNS